TVPMIRTDVGGGAGAPMSGLGRAVDVQPNAEASTISTAARPHARPAGLPLHLSMAPPSKTGGTALADRPVRSVPTDRHRAAAGTARRVQTSCPGRTCPRRPARPAGWAVRHETVTTR